MLMVLSPSKTLDFETKLPKVECSVPVLLKDTESLIKTLKKLREKDLEKLMGISPKLAALNASRFKTFKTPFTASNARPALFAFKGDVYEPLSLEKYGKKEIAYANQHLAMLSGLYGLLKPLDLMQPYRLEMGTGLAVGKSKNLYQFWGDKITYAVNYSLEKSGEPTLVNLASEEYWKAVLPKQVNGRIVNIIFKERQKGALKVIGLFAKRARGMMADFAILNQIEKAEELKAFKTEGYAFDKKLSDESDWVFVR